MVNAGSGWKLVTFDLDTFSVHRDSYPYQVTLISDQ